MTPTRPSRLWQRDGSVKTSQVQTTPQGRQSELPPPEILDRIYHFLLNLQQQIIDDHAITVKWVLHDTRKAVTEMRSIHVEEESPFTPLVSLHLNPSSTIPNGVPLVRIECYVSYL